jgi:hypothetical protein
MNDDSFIGNSNDFFFFEPFPDEDGSFISLKPSISRVSLYR